MCRGTKTEGAGMRLPYDLLSIQVHPSTRGVSSGSLEGFPTSNAKLTRRAMLRFAAQFAPGLLIAARDDSSTLLPRSSFSDARRMVRFPEKREMILLTDCPPQLETPLHYFRQNLTPNEAFFVQWHVAGVPTHVDTGAEPDKVSRTTAGNGARAPGPERKYSGHGDAAMGSTNERR